MESLIKLSKRENNFKREKQTLGCFSLRKTCGITEKGYIIQGMKAFKVSTLLIN